MRRNFEFRKLSLESAERDKYLLFYFLNLMGSRKVNLISDVDNSRFVFETSTCRKLYYFGFKKLLKIDYVGRMIIFIIA